ncbi:DUF2085 domain-containing protein [Fodinibius sediminis]|uniref:Uncharacterized membrane protein n=1 Tax=Fodinibius sediminis TaxID=1214077 RepID=A0A521F432_9BACT|nr:DUF2085 domain-containing protein [Fodinibius sediminis]SMO90957.1 Uncharacterized membrane protein [Fodinibius sediminis]
MEYRNGKLYLLALVLIMGVVISALGGGAFGQQEFWLMQWQHQAFMPLCHQIPERSFWIAGQPMAVCSRCLGIYTGFALGWLLLPVIDCQRVFHGLVAKRLLGIMLLVNAADVLGDFIGFWENTLISRWGLGFALGMTATRLFSGVFFNRKIKSTGDLYGRITSSGV